MCERHEANYIQSEGNKDRNSHDLFSHQSLHDPNDSEKSLTELNNDVRNDLEDFKRRIRSMRTVHWSCIGVGDCDNPRISVMAISVISISSDSSEDSVGTPAGRVILFGTIPTTIPDTTPVITPPATQTDTPVIPTETPIIAPTIPPSPDYTPASPDYSPASDLESDPSEDPSSDHIPPLPAISPFLSSDDDTIDSDTPDTPPSPTHGTPFTEIRDHLSYLVVGL
ncbi:hypothetical protein Tco_0371751 [Tanacetum coccineum]